MKYKICACCKKVLPETDFTKNLRNKDGLHSYCKKCNQKKAKEFNKSKGAAYRKKYSNKQVESGYFRYGHGAYVNMKNSAQKRQINFALTEQELSDWWLSTDDVCHYCGSSIQEYISIRDFIISYKGNNKVILEIKKKVFNKPIYEKIGTMTIDRVDSKGSYALSNIVKACWICNSIKGANIAEKGMIKKSQKIINLIKEEMKDAKK